jgi:hypothetical protein
MGSRAFETMSPSIALAVDAEAEIAHWRGQYRNLPHCADVRWEDIEPALKLGIDACLKAAGRDLTEMLDELEIRYRRTNSGSRLEWARARDVAAAAWARIWSQKPVPPLAHRSPQARQSVAGLARHPDILES